MVCRLGAGASGRLCADRVAQTQNRRQLKRAVLLAPEAQPAIETLIVGRSGDGLNINPLAAFVELHVAVDQREQGPVPACADVLAGDEFGPSLAYEDAAGSDKFAAEPFYTESLADTVAPVMDAAAAFLVSHKNLGFDFFDLHDRQFLTMPDGLVVPFAPFHLEGDLLGAAPVFHHIRDDTGLLHRRRPNPHLTVIVHEQYPVEDKGLTGLHRETFDFKRVACGDSILLSARFQYGIHSVVL